MLAGVAAPMAQVVGALTLLRPDSVEAKPVLGTDPGRHRPSWGGATSKIQLVFATNFLVQMTNLCNNARARASLIRVSQFGANTGR